jgi:hypothetical protein
MRLGLIVCIAGWLLPAPTERKVHKPTETTMTGCVDQRGDNFLLTGNEQLKSIAMLKVRKITHVSDSCSPE